MANHKFWVHEVRFTLTEVEFDDEYLEENEARTPEEFILADFTNVEHGGMLAMDDRTHDLAAHTVVQITKPTELPSDGDFLYMTR